MKRSEVSPYTGAQQTCNLDARTSQEYKVVFSTNCARMIGYSKTKKKRRIRKKMPRKREREKKRREIPGRRRAPGGGGTRL